MKHWQERSQIREMKRRMPNKKKVVIVRKRRAS